MNLENLKLAYKDWQELKEKIKPEQLDMKFFRKENGEETFFTSYEDCGTTGCFLGWFPFLKSEIFKPIKEDFFEEKEGTMFVFSNYEERLLGLNNDQFHWLFSQYWENNIEKCLERLKFLIDNEDCPKNFLSE